MQSSVRSWSSCYEGWTRRGIRVLAVAIRPVEADTPYRRDDERDLAFAGFLTFLDRPKEGVAEALAGLARARRLDQGHHRRQPAGRRSTSRRSSACAPTQVLTGRQLDELHDEALWHAAE